MFFAFSCTVSNLTFVSKVSADAFDFVLSEAKLADSKGSYGYAREGSLGNAHAEEEYTALITVSNQSAEGVKEFTLFAGIFTEDGLAAVTANSISQWLSEGETELSAGQIAYIGDPTAELKFFTLDENLQPLSAVYGMKVSGGFLQVPPTNQEVRTLLEANNPNLAHPRIIAKEDDWVRIRGLIETDSEMTKWYTRVKRNADRIISGEEAGLNYLPNHEGYEKARLSSYRSPDIRFYFPDGVRLLEISRRVKYEIENLATMYRITNEEKYAAEAYKILSAAAAFENTQENYPNPSGRDSYDEGWNPVHFLDAAEMCWAFAIGYDWLYDYITQEQRDEIRTAIYRKGILAADNRGLHWTTNKSNWNGVCNGGIGVAALAIGDEYTSSLFPHLIRQAAASIPLAIAEAEPEGSYPEGPGYWGYNFQYIVYFNAALKTALGTDFGLSGISGYRKTADYPIYVTGPGGTFNYADGRSSDAIRGEQLRWMAKEFNQPVLSWYQSTYGYWGAPFDLIFYDPDYCASPTEVTLPLDKKYDGTEALAIFRSSWDDTTAIYAAIKAGYNQTGHGHLDIGSFVFDAMGVRWAMDAGPENYNVPNWGGYTSNTGGRWDYFLHRAESHNTLVINPDSKADQNIFAQDKIDAFESGTDGGFAIINMNNAYSANANTVRRGFRLYDDRSKLIVQDEFNLKGTSGTVIWHMFTEAAVTVAADGKSAELTIGTGLNVKKLRLDILPTDASQDAVIVTGAFEPMPTSPNPAGNLTNYTQTMKDFITKLTIKLEGVKIGTLAVKLTPLYTGESHNGNSEDITPLNQWTLE